MGDHGGLALGELVLVLGKSALSIQHREEIGQPGPVLRLREFERCAIGADDSLEPLGTFLLAGIGDQSVTRFFQRP